MAKSSAPDSAGSQFFFVYGDSPLPPQYTLFGQLVEGLDVLRSIGAIPTQAPEDPANETPSATVVMESVTIEAVPGAPVGPLGPPTTSVPPESATAGSPAPDATSEPTGG
jgi:peptidyl-prolyl cis-trans isomerase B (cyclophilin B)